ncbi:hypothetical protein ACPW2B_001487 [Proteus mirabilis]|nr:hypothetical protein [Proteus mirabilis]ELB1186320.1 hypothetical protein [Proteus mirabilis]MBI6440000.1 hypothetical protein [Proteus mirabilis]HEK0628037.1 hypothetical protein [Proteus mirabilis]HEK1075695.1 hypothetical protein [Proteus mirabilis]
MQDRRQAAVSFHETNDVTKWTECQCKAAMNIWQLTALTSKNVVDASPP